LAKPGAQVKPQEIPSHVALAFGPLGHGAQRAPQVAVWLFLAQIEPQRW
jgi:hypothetical protein